MVQHDHHPYRHRQSQEEDVCEEEQRTAGPANKGSIGGACQEDSLVAEGGHNVEPGPADCTRTGLEPYWWSRLPHAVQTFGLMWCRTRVSYKRSDVDAERLYYSARPFVRAAHQN